MRHGSASFPMRVLITGGFGFLGGRLAQHFNEAGHNVVLGTRNRVNSPPAWLPQAKVVQTVWSDFDILEDICKGFDIVIHAAGMNARDSVQNPAAALEFNGLMTARLLNAAICSGVQKFVYFSTGHVYGSPLEGDVSELNSAENLHPYATSHRAGEDAVRYAHQQKMITGIVIRLSNSYGAPAHKNVNCWMLLVNDLCRQAVETGRMVLESFGVQLRDFIPMSSVCLAVHALTSKERQDLIDGLFNVGSGQSTSVWEMANTVHCKCELLLNKKISLSKVSSSETSAAFNYNIKKLMSTGVRLEIDHEREINRTINFCIEHFG